MKKIIQTRDFVLFVLFLSFSFTALRFLYVYIAENDARSYIASFSADELDRIETCAGRNHIIEIYDRDDQKEFLHTFSKLDPLLGGDADADGSSCVTIKMFYRDGRLKSITLPEFNCVTRVGKQRFSCTIDRQNPLLAFPNFYTF